MEFVKKKPRTPLGMGHKSILLRHTQVYTHEQLPYTYIAQHHKPHPATYILYTYNTLVSVVWNLYKSTVDELSSVCVRVYVYVWFCLTL